MHIKRRRSEGNEDGYIHKQAANCAGVRASRANVFIIGGGKLGAGAAGTQRKDLEGVLPVGASADEDLDNCKHLRRMCRASSGGY